MGTRLWKSDLVVNLSSLAVVVVIAIGTAPLKLDGASLAYYSGGDCCDDDDWVSCGGSCNSDKKVCNGSSTNWCRTETQSGQIINNCTGAGCTSVNQKTCADQETDCS